MYRLYKGVQIDKGFERGFALSDTEKETVMSNPKNSNYELQEEVASAPTFKKLLPAIKAYELSAATVECPHAINVVLAPNSLHVLVQPRR